jgi:hypothetical protein
MTPTKPEESAAIIDKDTIVPTPPNDQKDGKQSLIPGLPEKERLKPVQPVNKKKKEGQKKKGKDSKENNPTKKSNQMSKNDFLICPETGLDTISPEFVFSDADDESDGSDDLFEDPKEEITDKDETSTANVGDEFLTPVNLTFADLEKSTSRSTSMSTSNTAKRPSGSPADIKDPKKSRATQSQSLLPKKK